MLAPNPPFQRLENQGTIMRTTGQLSQAIARASVSCTPCTVNLRAFASQLIALIMAEERATGLKAVGISAAGNFTGKGISRQKGGWKDEPGTGKRGDTPGTQ
jgi:hypothetical protein